MRKLSKPAIVITAGVVVAAVIVSLLIGALLKNTRRTQISQLDMTGPGPARKNNTETQGLEEELTGEKKQKNEGAISDAIRKEQQMLKESEKGGYVGGVGVKKRKKDDDPLAGEIVVESDEAGLAPAMPKGAKHANVNGSAEAGGTDEQSRQKAWEYLYARKASGGFVNERAADNDGPKDQTGPHQSAAAEKKGPSVVYYKPYRAVVDRTFTSAQQNAVFVATVSEGPAKGWKATGKAAANYTDNRFHVDINGIVGPENAHVPMKGYVASIDQSDGIVSAVRHDDIAGTITSVIMAGTSSFLNALRKDTTTIEVGAGGVTVTGQTKADDRLREGGLAAGDTLFQGLSRKMEGSARKSPTLIMEKGVPVLIYFTP